MERKIQKSNAGFTVLFAVLVASLTLSIGAAIFSITFRELVLTSQARESHVAFNAADVGIECALFWDLKHPTFPGSIFGEFQSSVDASLGKDISSGLISHWKLDDGSGSVSVDSAAGDNDGILENMDPATDWVEGRVNGGLDFDVGSERVRVPHNSSISLEEYTYSFWVRPDAPPTGGWRTIIIKGNGGVDAERSPGIWLRPDDMNLHVMQSDSVGGQVGVGKTTISLVENEWNHVVITSSGDFGAIRTYINALFAGQSDHSADIVTNSSDLTMAENDSWGGSSDITLDDVRIFDRVLSDEEIQNLYEWRALAAEWNFEFNSLDTSGNGYNGTLQNGAGYTADGQIGTALDVKNVNGYMSALDVQDLYTGAVSFWFRPNQNIDSTLATTQGLYNKCESGSEDASISFRGVDFTGGEGTPGTILVKLESGRMQPGATYLATNTDTWTAGIWYHYVVTWGDGQTDVYIDGSSDGSKLSSHAISINADEEIGRGLYDGFNFPGTTVCDPSEQSHYFNGDIDNFRIFGSKLSQADVTILYQEGTGIDIEPVDAGDGVNCNGADITLTGSGWGALPGASEYVTSFTMGLPDGTCNSVWIRKVDDGTAQFDARGYNTCNFDNPRRIERGLRVTY